MLNRESVRQARIDLGRSRGRKVSQTELARAMGLDQSAISEMETGRIEWSEAQYERAMVALDAIESEEGVPV